MDSQKPKTVQVRRRFDFVQEVLTHDDDTRTITALLTPDPRRYDRVNEDGRTWYHDRFLGGRHSLSEMAAGLGAPLPIFASGETIESAADYAEERREALMTELNGGDYAPPLQAAKPHTALQASADIREIVFISVDVCGATALRVRDRSAFDRALEVLLRELGTVVGQFGGAILKTTGDGFIAYIDHPAFTTQCDLGAKLGLSLAKVATGSLAPALKAACLPDLAIRVGADFGEAEVRRIVVPTTGYEAVDMASDALNRAVKVQESAAAGEFRIGQGLYTLLHGRFLERCLPAPFDYEAVGLAGYRVFTLA